MMWNDVIWYDIWYDTIWYDMIYYVIYDMIYDMIYDIWPDMTWHDLTWPDMTWHMTNDKWHDMVHGMTWHDTTRHDTARHDMTFKRFYEKRVIRIKIKNCGNQKNNHICMYDVRHISWTLNILIQPYWASPSILYNKTTIVWLLWRSDVSQLVLYLTSYQSYYVNALICGGGNWARDNMVPIWLTTV